MRRWLIALALFAAAAAPRVPSSAAEAVRYRFSFPEPSQRWMQVDATFAELPAAPPGILATRAGRILVVDDEQMLCSAIERILGADHYVTTVTSARDALSRLGGGERFDLVLCDLMMPEMTGMDLYDELQQSMPDQAARFIFMSGGAFTDNARVFLARSSNEIIDKPFKSAGLRQIVRRFLQ